MGVGAYEEHGQMISRTEVYGTALARTTTWEYAPPDEYAPDDPGLVLATEHSLDLGLGSPPDVLDLLCRGSWEAALRRKRDRLTRRPGQEIGGLRRSALSQTRLAVGRHQVATGSTRGQGQRLR